MSVTTITTALLGLSGMRGVPGVESPPLPGPAPLLRDLLHGRGDIVSIPVWVRQLGATLATHLAYLFALAVGATLAAFAVRALRTTRARRQCEGGRVITIAIPPQVEPHAAQAFWTNMSALLRPAWKRLLIGQPHLSWEVTATSGTGITMQLWVPQAIPPGLIERAAEAAWPGARTTVTHGPRTHDSTLGSAADPGVAGLLNAGVAVTAGRLRLAAPACYPLRTEHENDPLRPVLAALAELPPGFTAAVQLLIRPASARHTRRLAHAARLRRSGRHPRNGNTFPGLSAILRFATGSPQLQRTADADPSRSRDVTAILTKSAGPSFQVSLRYFISAPLSPTSRGSGNVRAEDARSRATSRGRAHALASAYAAYTDRNALTRDRLPRARTLLIGRVFDPHPDLLGVSEVAALAHLPTDPVLPGLTRAGARSVAASPLIPTTGKILGHSDTTNRVTTNRETANPNGIPEPRSSPVEAARPSGRPVALSPVDARQHLHVMGSTGSGKSTLLTNLILGDITAGRGVVVIDPKGDLVTDLLDRLPARALHRTVLLDPEETTAPPALNVLAGTDPDLTVDNLVGIFRSIFAAFWGPRTDDILRSACLTLLRNPTRRANPGGAAGTAGREACLADVPRLLTDPVFRATLTQGLADPSGLGGFWTWYDGMGDAARAQAVGPLLNKLRAFLLRDSVRRLVGTPTSTFTMAEVLDGGVCLVRIPKGTLGEDTCRLLGSFVVAQVWQAATHRAALGEHARVDAALYVDECQNFLTLPRSFDDMLAEARGYHLSLVLAHQHLGQLPRDLREAIAANARSKLWFNLSPEDARPLARHTLPELTEHDLAHLPAHTAAARLLVAGTPAPACTVLTRPAPPVIPGRAGQARQACRERYGLPVGLSHARWAASPAHTLIDHGLVFPTPDGPAWREKPTDVTGGMERGG